MATCSCCCRDVSASSEKKGRRLLSSATLHSKLKILLELIREKMPASGPALDVGKYVEGYICRHCVGLLKNFEDHRRKLTDTLESLFPLEERLLTLQPSASLPTTPLRSRTAPTTQLQFQTTSPQPRVHFFLVCSYRLYPSL